MEGVERHLASVAASVRWNELPDSTRRESVRAVLDYLAAAIAGYRFGEIRPALARVVPGDLRGEASLIGSKKRASLSDAVLFNGTMGHAVEMDDGERLGAAHIGSVVVPVALALGAHLGRSGPEVLEAIVAGYEVMVRISSAVAPSHTIRGFHPTGYCGTFGAATAAARLLRLPERGIHAALGTAGLLGAGLLEVDRSGQMMKPLHAGRAAEAGLLAARLAEAGAEGPVEILSGPRGFGQAVADAVNWDCIMAGRTDVPWAIEARYIKPYPTCRHIHVPIDLGLRVHRELHPRAEDILSIHISTYSHALRETGQIKSPVTAAMARFSMAYCVASAIVRGSLTNEDLMPEALRDDTVLALAQRVQVTLGEKQEAGYPEGRPNAMRVELADGSVTLEAKFPTGEQENPLSDTGLDQKVRTCCGSAIESTRVEQLIRAVRALPEAAVCPDLPAICSVN